MFDRMMSRPWTLLAILTAIVCWTYFHLVDRMIFSTSAFVPIFKFLLIHDDAETAWLVLGVCVLAAGWQRPASILALVDRLGRHPRTIAILSVPVFAMGSLFVYHNYPLCMDEYAAVFQAKIFAAGHLSAHLPPAAVDWLVVRGFNGSFLYASRETGQAMEAYWPGFALLLAPFQLVGIPWACNAMLAGAAIYLVCLITLQITNDRRAAGWAILFTLSSGAFVAYALSYYSMQAHLTLNLLFAYLLLRPTRERSLAAGLVGSLALVLHNPFPHALFAAPWLLSMAADRRQRLQLAMLVLGYLPGLCVGVGWLMLRMTIDQTHTLAASGVGQGVFIWPDAALFNLRTASVVKLWLWACPGLLLFAMLGVRRAFADRGARLLAWSAALTFIGYFFVRFDQGNGWGYRYFHSAWGAIPILAAVAMVREKAAGTRPLISFAGAAAVLSFCLIVPFQLWQIERFIAQHLAQLPAPIRPGKNVYFINPRAGFYLADMIQIDPLLRGPDLLLVSRGAGLDAQLIRQNWPNARETAHGLWGRQWTIGSVEFDRLRFVGPDTGQPR